MPIIKILPHEEICPQGAEFIAESNKNICQQLLDHGIEIEHACDMACACTTCHVIIRNGFNSLNEINELEEDLLDRAWGLTSVSRLSCQAIVDDENLVIEIPKYTINHAKEG
ncbi:MAG TPA: ISC system 2Fe-2S type ferredoxin [Burkholderiales bacterium]|nr:ISC system 2Fe-2S type ferredoxin [Burkholderiales bacterium]